MENFLSDITYNIKKKQITAIISLFNLCNQKCKFCNQLQVNKLNSISEQIVVSYIPKLYKILFEQAKLYNISKINLLFEGGQIFTDLIDDDFYQCFNIIKKQIDVCFQLKPVQIKFITSGIFLKRQRILQILNKLNASLILSYDPCNRFLVKTQKKTFLDTLQFFSKYNKLDSLNTVLTKPNINAYINDSSELFNLCKKYNLKINLLYYIPNKNYELFLPSQEDLYNFYKFAINSDWKSLCQPIHNIIRGINNYKNDVKFTERYCNCLNTYRINPQNQKYTSNCINCLSNKANYNLQNISEIQSENIILNGQIKYHCNSCKYKMNCILPCWNLLNNNLFKTQNCPLYRIIQEQL